MSNSNFKILLVDDEPDIVEFLGYNLKKEGYTILTANNGKDAVEIAKKEIPHLIVLDVMMPDLDGPATLQRLRADPNTAQIPVIFLTAKMQTSEVKQYQAMGAIDVIAKPFDPMLLATQVQKIWDQHHG